MKTQARLFLLGCLGLTALGTMPAAQAEPYGHRWAPGYHFHYDAGRWRGGHWVQGWHGGHYGWWWLVGASWLLYPSPVYPYPDPDVAPAYVIDDTMVAAAPPVQQAAPPPPAPSVWYYCPSAQGYYPYVPACPTGWQTVPAQPATHP